MLGFLGQFDTEKVPKYFHNKHLKAFYMLKNAMI